MKRVLTFMDEDSHMHVYDVSTKPKLKKVIFAILQAHLDGNYIHIREDVEEAKKAIQNEDTDAAIDLINDCSDAVSFDRSGGGRMYIVEVKSDWDQRSVE